MPVFNISHRTTYEYDRQIKESVNYIRIYPYATAEQEVLQHELLITGQPDVHTFLDYWNNKTGIFNLLAPHRQLVLESRLVVRTTPTSQLQVQFHTNFQDLETEVSGQLRLLELVQPEHIQQGAAVEEILAQLRDRNTSVAGTVEAVCEYIYKYFKYEKGITTIETTVDEILTHRSGVCQDFVHLMLQLLRTLRIPSRYVSGYICPNKNGMRGEGATHAWVEAWIPGYGWAGVDPTNNTWVTNKHVKLAVGRNFNDCSPVKGAFKGPARQRLTVSVSVGYEDGHRFEDKSPVQITTPGSEQEPPPPDRGEAQQQ